MIRALKAMILGACLSALYAQAEGESIDLMIEVIGAAASEGQVLVTLFDDESSYMKMPLAEHIEAVDSSGKAVVVFPQLSEGDYAAAVIYDRDSDGELDTGLFGIPTEKIGFSNNARGRMGPAEWSDAQFQLTHDNSSISIYLGNPRRN